MGGDVVYRDRKHQREGETAPIGVRAEVSYLLLKGIRSDLQLMGHHEEGAPKTGT